jgi:hypothetical protein
LRNVFIGWFDVEDPDKTLCMMEAFFSVQDNPLLLGRCVDDGAVLVALKLAVVKGIDCAFH